MSANERSEIRIIKDGPYIVTGNVPLSETIIEVNEDDCCESWREGRRYSDRETYSLCRCGESSTKPYCDGTHAAIGFDGTETAPREDYADKAEVIDGPTMQLLDVKWLCAEARFCARAGGAWHIIDDTEDPDSSALLREECANCPSGRYVAVDKASGEWLEPALAESIGLVQDPQEGVSGPIWVRGGIPVVAADGFEYEVRNRQTLCRCGKSKQKPFCDGSHIEAGFYAE